MKVFSLVYRISRICQNNLIKLLLNFPPLIYHVLDNKMFFFPIVINARINGKRKWFNGGGWGRGPSI